MHVHILGICGTFMGGIAALARQAGHEVTGSDLNVYPPMSTQLEALGICLTEGWDPAQLEPTPDVVIIGNALSRGNPAVEAVLNRGLRYTSGPAWLAEHVLQDRWVLAVAGTHGKTTTTSILSWILEYAHLEPGFLIGGVPGNFTSSARLGAAPFFVVEADEYDTAFFDKRAKFVHYRPRTVILNNLEYDHADIYPDIASIRRMFHQLVRTVPGDGQLIVNAADPELEAALALGAWTPRQAFGRAAPADWQVRPSRADWSAFEIWHGDRCEGEVHWNLIGAHNAENALAALVAARHAGVTPAVSIAALPAFRNARRRMELRGVIGGVAVYDDFAHHPTAIAATVGALRDKVGGARILAVLEPRSATMKMGVHRDTLAASLAAADRVFLYEPADLGWDVAGIARALGERGCALAQVDALTAAIMAEARAGDHVLVMSNGGFGGLHGKLLAALAARG
ncbi:MAG: UDP-N-acetylmuramate:L-alanyl-gamma-D-glutamyl-meso-diaminopimelate ligase [Pseudomonadota bacterium]